MREKLKKEIYFHSFDEIINHCLFIQLVIDVEFLVREKTRKKENNFYWNAFSMQLNVSNVYFRDRGFFELKVLNSLRFRWLLTRSFQFWDCIKGSVASITRKIVETSYNLYNYYYLKHKFIYGIYLKSLENIFKRKPNSIA